MRKSFAWLALLFFCFATRLSAQQPPLEDQFRTVAWFPPGTTGKSLNVRVQGATVLFNGTNVVVPDQVILLPDNATTFIDFEGSKALVTSQVGFGSVNSVYYPIALVITSQGNVSQISDQRPTYTLSSGGGGGGATPPPPAGIVPVANALVTGFIASSILDNGTIVVTSEPMTVGALTSNGDSTLKGPNPYTDVRLFGARGLIVSQTPAVPGITATTINGNNQVAISTNTCPSQPQVNNACFLNGDGVTIYNVGPAITMSTPSAPTVTPSQAQAGTGTGRVVSAPTGASTFNYKVLACDINLGCTAASTAGTTATGNTLGPQSIAVTSITRAVDTLTFNTASAPNLAVGAVVHVDGCSNADNANGFCGSFKVSTVTGTGFTSVSTGLTTVNGAATTSLGGGTANWWNANHVSWTGQSGVFRYVVQSDRQSPGTFVNIGMSWAINPQFPSSFTDGTLTFDDFGQTMMARSAVSIPAYVPSNGSATNDALTTTITNVSGTTLTLTVAPSQNLSGQTILFDDAPTEAAAISAASAVWFPVPSAGGYVTNSILNLTGAGLNKSMFFPAGAFFGDTVITGSNPNWYGNQLQAGSSAASFTPKSVPQISFGSTPGILIANGQGGEINSLQFNGAPNGIAVQQDGGGGNLGTTYNFVNFLGAGLSSDYMSMGFLCRGVPAQGSCLSKMGTVLITAGTQAMTDTSFTPSAYWDDDGDSTINNLMGSARGMQVRGDPAGSQLTIGAYHWQGGTSPLVTVSNTGGTNISLGVLGESIVDTGANAVVFNVGDSNQQVSVSCGANLFACGAPSSALPALTGQAVNFVSGTVSGQNKNAISGYNFTDNTITVNGTTGSMGYIMNPPAAPTLSISGASGPAAGTYYYALIANDTIGNGTLVGTVSSGITVNGSQGVLVTFPSPQPGQATTSICRGQVAGTVSACNIISGQGFQVVGTSFLDNGTFFPSNSAPTVPRALSSGIGSTGIETQAVNVVGGGFKSAESGTFTANRTRTVPDKSGIEGILDASCNSSNFLGGDNVCRAGSGVNISTNSTLNLSQTVLNMQTSTVNAVGLSLTPNNPSGGIETYEIAGRLVPFGGGTGISSPAAHSFLVTEGAANMNLVTSPAVNGFYACGFNVAASAAVDPTCSLQGVPVNTPSTPYTGLFSDRATYQRLTGGSTFAFTLPQVTGNTAANFPFVVQNGNSSLLTFTANAADKIDNSGTGGTSTLLSNFAAFVYQDSSSAPGNWWTIKLPTFSAFGSTCANILSWSTSTGFSCANATGAMFANFSAHQFLGNNTGSSAAPSPSLIGASDTSPNAYAVATGTAQAQVVTLTPAATALTAGLEVDFLPVAANTGAAPTLNVNGLGAVSITKLGSSAALVANDLTTNAIAKVIYDGTEWQLLNPQTTSGSSVPCTTTAGALQYNNAGAFGCATPFTFAANTITAAAAGILDLSGATGANALKIPVQAGCSAGADGAACYDSTNKNTHIRTNAADSIAGAFASIPTTGDVVDTLVASSNTLLHDSGILSANLVTQTSNAASGQVCTYTGANKVCVPATALPNGVTATTQTAGDNTTDVATDAFVTTAVANGIAASNPAVAVQAATVGSSDLSGYTYNNGVSGIGATLTAGSNNVALTVDGFTFNGLAQRLLVKNQSTAAQNGVYTVTQLQGVALPVILTRALDYDQPSDINNTGAIPVVNGTVNADTSWLLTSTVNTVGTDSLTYVQFSLAPTSLVTASAAAGSSKQVCLSAGASKTCSYITFPDTKYAPAANCVNAVAGSGWSTGATPAALCRAGTNNKTGLLSPWGASDVGYIQFHIPADADLTTQLPSLLLEVTTTENSTHTIIMQESVACAKEDGSTTDDVAFNAARSFATVTETSRANQVFDTTITLNSTDLTGCVAPGIMWVKVSRTTDTATNVGVYGLSLTTYRLLTVQAN